MKSQGDILRHERLVARDSLALAHLKNELCRNDQTVKDTVMLHGSRNPDQPQTLRERGSQLGARRGQCSDMDYQALPKTMQGMLVSTGECSLLGVSMSSAWEACSSRDAGNAEQVGHQGLCRQHGVSPSLHTSVHERLFVVIAGAICFFCVYQRPPVNDVTNLPFPRS